MRCVFGWEIQVCPGDLIKALKCFHGLLSSSLTCESSKLGFKVSRNWLIFIVLEATLKYLQYGILTAFHYGSDRFLTMMAKLIQYEFHHQVAGEGVALTDSIMVGFNYCGINFFPAHTFH